MDNSQQNPLDEQDNDNTEVESQAPEQQAIHKWEFQPRQNPKWGTVEKRGLVVGRKPNQKVIPPDEVYYLASLGCTQREIAEKQLQIAKENKTKSELRAAGKLKGD
jgi:hypothetical protein